MHCRDTGKGFGSKPALPWLRAWRWGLAWLFLWGFGAWAASPASGPAQMPPPVLLYSAADGVPLETHTAFLLDPDSSLTISDVRTQAVGARFTPMQGPLYQAGNQGAVWFAIRLRQVEFDGNWVISLPAISIQDIHFYGPIDGVGREQSEPVMTGSHKPYSTRALGNEQMLMPIKLQLPGDYMVYVRSSSLTNRTYEFKVWDVAAFYRHDQTRRLFDGLCYGVMLGLLVYNFVLYLIFRDRSYGLYVLQGVFALLSVATFNGHLFRYILPEMPVMADRFNIIMPALWIATAGLFAHTFLALPRFAPRLGWLVILASVLSMGTAVFGAIGALTIGQALNEYISTVSTVVVCAAGIMAWYRGFHPARLYLLGQATLFLAVYSVVFSNWGWIPQSVFVDASLQVGISLEFMIFALALSSRIRLLQDIQIEMTRKAVALTQASETDPLTNVANRAGLASAARKLLVNSERRTVILIDLDKFKPINDQHGHAAGDAMLVEIGKRLKSVVRGGDVVARVGGDEFVILISEPHERAMLESIAKRLLETIKQPLLFANASLAVGGSLGMATYPDNGNTLDDLLHAADVAMYHIKKNGRDGFAFFDDLNDKEAQEAVQDLARAGDKGGDSVLFD